MDDWTNWDLAIDDDGDAVSTAHHERRIRIFFSSLYELGTVSSVWSFDFTLYRHLWVNLNMRKNTLTTFVDEKYLPSPAHFQFHSPFVLIGWQSHST